MKRDWRECGNMEERAQVESGNPLEALFPKKSNDGHREAEPERGGALLQEEGRCRALNNHADISQSV